MSTADHFYVSCRKLKASVVNLCIKIPQRFSQLTILLFWEEVAEPVTIAHCILVASIFSNKHFKFSLRSSFIASCRDGQNYVLDLTSFTFYKLCWAHSLFKITVLTKLPTIVLWASHIEELCLRTLNSTVPSSEGVRKSQSKHDGSSWKIDFIPWWVKCKS